jgi:hypothetical protein
LGWKNVEMAECDNAEPILREQFQQGTGFSSISCACKKMISCVPSMYQNQQRRQDFEYGLIVKINSSMFSLHGILHNAFGKLVCTYERFSSIERIIVSKTELNNYTLYWYCTSTTV